MHITKILCTQNLTTRIFLINGGLKYCIKREKTTINFLSSTQKECILPRQIGQAKVLDLYYVFGLSNCRTIGLSD
jgi:hypothetical protein